jgi:BlaI family transcriptional regulator, penicillinase repressor
MADQALPRPTEGELEILRVLWRRGPSTVREVQDDLVRDRQPGYTTVLKLLQIMAEKGLVSRDESGRAHVYRAAAAEEETQSRLVDHLLDRAFGGSAAQLVMRALSSRPASAAELAEIRRLLDAYETEGGRR